ncbi:phenazine biosynthesis-like domain-containing protein 1 isoform X2 [Neoarius graeffei]|uniref:phenazine biosynthesis-like domain-containing protein 1 isoform X2 n=1 Tax=Neoarius graeffei TaxID=443677 RepID=UPI00298C0FA7|nr:phenazine biosynthesis-like domain-containing protein 1 isoform X2 [Neoarius graeffei]
MQLRPAKISAMIAKSGRSLSCGEFVKSCLTVAAETVSPSQTRAFSQISLSWNTVTRRIEDMAEDLREQIVGKASRFTAFSIACDESTDICDYAQLMAFLRGVSEDFEVTQELAGLETLSGARFGLRWFTPTHEVNLCGHATLASAAVLFYKKKNPNSVVAFETLSGELLVHQRGESLVMVFPLNKPEVQDRKNFTDILKAAVGDLPIQEVCYCKTTKELLVCLLDTCDRSMLTSLRPMTESLLKSEDSGRIKSLTITVKGAPTSQLGYDFYSRNFAPWVGIPEDPVTAYQCSKRGGELELELRGDNRVDIAGRAVVLLQGILKL